MDVLPADGSTITVDSEDWEPATIITANADGSGLGYVEQGVVSLYQWSGQNWVEKFSFVSPRQAAHEKFGSKITIGVADNNY